MLGGDAPPTQEQCLAAGRLLCGDRLVASRHRCQDRQLHRRLQVEYKYSSRWNTIQYSMDTVLVYITGAHTTLHVEHRTHMHVIDEDVFCFARSVVEGKTGKGKQVDDADAVSAR